jgi:hypothetical protein
MVVSGRFTQSRAVIPPGRCEIGWYTSRWRTVRWEVAHVGFHTGLPSKGYEYALPGIDKMPWGTRDMTVKDPFGNKLTLTNAIST